MADFLLSYNIVCAVMSVDILLSPSEVQGKNLIEVATCSATLTLTITMGKLNIAHHKSYHPYRRDNIDRVRRDEEDAAAKEAKEEGRVLLADSEARIDLLRGKAGSGSKGKGKKKESVEDITGEAGPLTGGGGHINFFEDLEHVSIPLSALILLS